MFEEFTTIAYLLSYPGMLLAVVMLTQFTKAMFNLSGVDTIEKVVFFWCIVFAFIAAVFQGSFSTAQDIVSTIIVWFVNAVIIWFAAMKSYEKISGTSGEITEDGVFYLDQSDENTDKFLVDLGDNLANLASNDTITLKVNTEKKLE